LDVRPDLPRSDVGRRIGSASHNLGFDVTLPRQAHPLRIATLLPSGEVRHVMISHPADPRAPRARRRMRRAFCRDMIRALPALLAYGIRPDDARKREVKARLGLTTGPFAPRLDPSWFGSHPTSEGEGPVGPFTIIMPVHNGIALLREALDRVTRNTTGDWRMILVDDASTDAEVPVLLAAWVAAREGRATLVTLTENVGFVGAVNRGLAAAEDGEGPVVLLNSDAHVPPGWAERLLAPLSDPAVASATPFSNTAEIFSAPLAGQSVAMTGVMADRIDGVARTLGPPADLPSAPTGVGFCMALSRRWLNRVPRLDPAFGRGYGEEVDWCQKVRAMGGRHVGVPGLFVLHAGGASFGPERTRLRATAAAMLSRRYPRYDAEVQDFLLKDPLRTPRLALAIAWAGFGARDGLPVYLAHSLGGGANMALEREIARDLRTCGAAVVIRVGGASRFRVELHLPTGRLDGATDTADVLRAMLVAVPRLRIVYSCGVGDPLAHELPGLLLRLRRDVLRDRLEARLHDFFPVSPSYCLLGADGCYRGPVRGPSPDPAHRYTSAEGRSIDLREWQRRWHALLSACDEITVYAPASAEVFGAAFPDLSHRVRLRAPQPVALPERVIPDSGATVLGVLGNLNAQKGARVIQGLARRLSATGDPRSIVVIGNVDASISLPARVRIHGGYDNTRIAELARRYGICAWLIPSVWPETYSFATREALATGLPVFAFDIGAQGEAVRAAPNGTPVPHDPDADLALRLIEALPPIPADPAHGNRPRALPYRRAAAR
jgi:GT2 family glycosyltransferase